MVLNLAAHVNCLETLVKKKKEMKHAFYPRDSDFTIRVD